MKKIPIYESNQPEPLLNDMSEEAMHLLLSSTHHSNWKDYTDDDKSIDEVESFKKNHHVKLIGLGDWKDVDQQQKDVSKANKFKGLGYEIYATLGLLNKHVVRDNDVDFENIDSGDDNYIIIAVKSKSVNEDNSKKADIGLNMSYIQFIDNLAKKGKLSDEHMKRRDQAVDILKTMGVTQEELKDIGYEGDLLKHFDSINESSSTLEKVKNEARIVSRDEGVVQHVNKKSLDSEEYEVSDWYDSDLTVASYENGKEL